MAGWLADQITRPPGLILLWLLGLLNVFRLAIQLPPKFADFNHYYVSALALREGINPYVTRLDPMARSLGLDLAGINKASYPPTFLLCFEALTHLPPHRPIGRGLVSTWPRLPPHFICCWPSRSRLTVAGSVCFSR